MSGVASRDGVARTALLAVCPAAAVLLLSCSGPDPGAQRSTEGPSGAALGSSGISTTVEIPPVSAGGVTLAQADRRSFPGTLSVPGKVYPKPDRVVAVRPRAAGTVVHAELAVGTKVRRGALLVMLESDEVAAARARYREARARTPGTADDEDARRRLLDLGVSPDDRSEQRVNHPGHVRLRSPITGTLLSRTAVVGQKVEAGEVLAEVASLDEVLLRAELPVGARDNFAVGESITVKQPSGAAGRARIVRSSVGNAASPGREIEATFINSVPPLLPGQSVVVDIPGAGPAEAALAVPLPAIQRSRSSLVVFVALDRGRYEQRPVAVGRSSEGFVEIRSGLAAGEHVVAGPPTVLATLDNAAQ